MSTSVPLSSGEPQQAAQAWLEKSYGRHIVHYRQETRGDESLARRKALEDATRDVVFLNSGNSQPYTREDQIAMLQQLQPKESPKRIEQLLDRVIEEEARRNAVTSEAFPQFGTQVRSSEIRPLTADKRMQVINKALSEVGNDVAKKAFLWELLDKEMAGSQNNSPYTSAPTIKGKQHEAVTHQPAYTSPPQEEQKLGFIASMYAKAKSFFSAPVAVRAMDTHAALNAAYRATKGQLGLSGDKQRTGLRASDRERANLTQTMTSYVPGQAQTKSPTRESGGRAA